MNISRVRPAGHGKANDSNAKDYELGLHAGGTARDDADAADMRKLRVEQQTERRFGLVTLLGFTTTTMCT